MHLFKEHHPEFKGFSDYYHREVFPLLAVRDEERREALRKAQIFGSVIVVAAIALATFLYSSGRDGFIIYTLGGGLAGVFALYSWLIKGVRGETKEKIVGGICAYIGWTFSAEVTEKPDLSYWTRLGLVPKVFGMSHSSFEDQMSGQAHGAKFNSVEVHLERKGDKSWHTVMRGQLPYRCAAR